MNSRLRAFFFLIGCLVFAAVPVAAHTYGGSYVGPVTFNSADILTAANLNQAIQHVHNTFGNIVNSHISASAAISHTKLANPALLPRAQGIFYDAMSGAGPYNYTACTTATCAITNSDRVTSVTHAASVYSVTLAYTPATVNFGVQVTAVNDTNHSCRAYDFNTAAPHFKIKCGAPAAAAAQFTVYDYEN